ncbi:MAG TPA: WG repeat-containing protein [Candidatus Bathyarchaeia archaeon]|nr:WG repeat-containing protein [Candidatus Bathyarchaeia archaeon]
MSMQPIRHLLPYTENQEDGSNIMYIRIEPALLYLEAGQTSKIKVYAVLTDGRNEEITHKVKWQSQHTTIGKVNEEGTITAVEPGNMSIVAEYEQHKAELIVAIDKKEKAAAKREKKSGGKFGKVGALTVAATLFVATGVYGAVQIFTSDESVSGPVSQTAAEPVATGNEPVQDSTSETTVAAQPEEAEELTPTSSKESTGEDGLTPATEDTEKAVEETQPPGDQVAASPSAPITDTTAASAAPEPTNTGTMLGALHSLLATQKTGSTPAAAAAQTPPVSPATTAPTGGAAASTSTQPIAVKPQAAPVKTTTTTTTAVKPKQTVQTTKQPTTRRTTTTVQKQPVKTVATTTATAPKTVVASSTKPTPVATQPKAAAATSVMLVPVEKAGKWGYKRAGEDEVTIPYNFDHATKFSDGLALVKKDGKFGYINSKGQVVIPFEYSYATSFSGGKATVKKDGQLGTIDKNGSFRAN